MNSALRLSLGVFSIFGAIVFANGINDVDSSLTSTLVIAVIYQVLLAILGGILYLLGFTLDFAKTNEIEPEKTEQEKGFEIKEILTDGSKIIGTFDGKEIYDGVKVLFENGHTADYVYQKAIDYDKIENIDLSKLTPGALIMEPGVVYIPVK